MKSDIQFLTTPTADTPGTSLLLHFDSKRYLIGNIHEGSQRSLIQRGKRLNKVTDIFLTGKTEWKNTGGLIGMILTLADTLRSAAASTAENMKLSRLKRGSQESLSTTPLKGEVNDQERVQDEPSNPTKNTLTIHGSPNVTHTLATARRFVFRKGMPVDVNEIRERKGDMEWDPTWSDENILVWAMSVEPDTSPAQSQSQPPRKRSFHDFMELTPDSQISSTMGPHDDIKLAEQELHDQQIRRGVISHMFNSDWRLDALFETPLEDVNMPAALFIRNAETRKIEQYSGPMPGGIEPLPKIKVLVRRPWPGALIAHLPPTKPSYTALSYIIRNHPQRGKFQPQKAIALGVPKGRLFSELTSGRSVTSKDGTTVSPEQVLGPSKSGGGLAVVELPSDAYIRNLTMREEWKASRVMEGVEAIVWILGPGVINNQNLQDFMAEMSRVKHIVSSEDCCSNYLSLDSAAAAEIRLHQIDSERYPIPIHNNQPATTTYISSYNSEAVSHWIPAQRGLQIQLEPAVTVQEHLVAPPLDTAKVLREMPKDALYLAKAIKHEISSELMQRELGAQNLPSSDSEIVFLGTGSALPSKYRNVSGTLLRVPGSGSYLFDAGENTLGQLSRIYTQKELLEVLRDLKMIWISHLHADHHLGITSVIKAWYKAVYGENYVEDESAKVSLREQSIDPAKVMLEQQRLFIVSDEAMNHWLAEYASVEDFGFDKLVTLNIWAAKPGKPDTTRMEWNGTPVGFNTIRPSLNQAMRTATGLTKLAAANVPHCHGSKAVAVTFDSGFKFAYSGDCRPSRSFAEIGKGATVLLHEATFDDELRGDAQAKLHSTTSEAIGVGIAMGARRVLLTHFSQRYQKLPVMDGISGQDFELESEKEASAEDSMAPVDTGELPARYKTIGEMVEDDSALTDLLAPTPRKPMAPTVDNVSPVADILSPYRSKPSSARISKVNTTRHKPANDMKIGVAFDYMRVKVKDIALLEKFTPALLKLYDQSLEHDSGGNSDEGQSAGARNEQINREKTNIGGGRMGRVRQSEGERKAVRRVVGLFDDQAKGDGRKAT
ncbi:Zinc phosphodiesterase ELAC protein 2 [Xylographa bjoerkii]|nr:Zinc phosphodiesterase ELAC protein 2 [Xylographa bjoerkii]